MPAPKVLISDDLSPMAVAIFKERGVTVDFRPGLSKDELLAAIPVYDGLAIRSATKVTDKVIAAAVKLRVVGRAGIGVDNVDIKAATAKGVIVMNTPFGNSITTAEHAIALIMALARQLPAADRSTQAGKWEKNRFMGVEVTGKTLGIVGCGNIGSIVADRALGLKMHVLAYDPFLTPERALEIGVEKCELADLLPQADFITLHTPLTEKTRGIIDAAAFACMKKGVRIINCARGGLIVEDALADALEAGHVAGAALDVFMEEPAKQHRLFGRDDVICTPHLGAATTEAQEKVALQVAEQMCDYLLKGAITNAINFPSISAEEAPRLRPFIKLAEQLGRFAGQVSKGGLSQVQIEYAGDVATMNVKALTAALLAGVLAPMMEGANMVSAPSLARGRGIVVAEATRGQRGAYETYIRVVAQAAGETRSVGGTVFSDGRPRIIEVDGISLEAELGPHMLLTQNADKPGYIGAVGSLLGNAQVNIANFSLGRDGPGGKALALMSVDDRVPNAVLAAVLALPHVVRADRLEF